MTRGRLPPPVGWPLWTALGLFAGGAAIRVRAWSFGESFWIDEVLSARAIGAGPGGVLSRIAVDKPPLDYWLQSVTAGLGEAEWSHRLPALVSGILAMPLAYLLGRLAYNWRVGLAMLGMVAFSGSMVYYSAEARPYMPLVALSFGQVGALVGVWRQRWRPHSELVPQLGILFVLSVALVWTMYSGFLVLGAEALFLAWQAVAKWRSCCGRERAGARLSGAVAGCITLLPGLSIVPLTSRLDLVSRGDFPFVYTGDHLLVAAQALSGGLHMPSALLGPIRGQVLVAAGLIVLAMLPVLGTRDRRGLLFLPIVLAGVGMIAGYWWIDREFYPRYSLPCAPGVMVLVAAGLVRAGGRLRGVPGRLLVPAWVALLGVALVPQEARRPLRLDWRGAMAEVGRKAGAGEVLIVPSHPEAINALYYLERAGRGDVAVLIQADAWRVPPDLPHWSLQVFFPTEGPTEKVRLGLRRVHHEPPAESPDRWFGAAAGGGWSVLAGALPDGPVAGGWSTPEQWGDADANVRWAMRRDCILYLPLGGSAGRLTMWIFPYQFPDGPAQGVELAVNGLPVGRRELAVGRFTAAAWEVPARAPGEHGWSRVELRFDRLRSPSEDRRNYSDWRQLAAAVGRISWEPAGAP